MRIEKRNYVKPYTAVMNVQTEGIIAASGEIIIDYDKLCGNDYISGFNSCSNSITCNIPKQDHLASCNQVTSVTKTYATCYKDMDKIYHVQVIEDKGEIGVVDNRDIVKLTPCNCKKRINIVLLYML